MTIETIERTNLWKSNFNLNNDSNDKHRERYKSAFLRFRERVGHLLSFIPGDMKQYTVHDLSHLDALWEMANTIAGDSFSLNPAEAFVFGGAVLLHDAGMSIAAYPGGLDFIKSTPEWPDSYNWACAALNLEHENQNNDAVSLAITDVLRRKHAAKANELATQHWSNPLDGSQEHLLEDSDLRSHFGEAIGTIAYSHHWSIRNLLTKLQPTLGAFGETPSEWTVDIVKIALLLRCADAAHLDHRRAPRLLFALMRPGGIAKTHWTFQAKLSKPQPKDGKLIYSSRSSFTLSEINSWHLCWDMMKMVDRELSDSCDALLDRGLQPFAISGVIGAKSADSLAKHVLVEGWRPIPAELQVSDVPRLARTLGGTDLYSNPIAPLRELLQNAADAIDARNAIDNDFHIIESKIIVRVIRETEFITISVEDDGLGMSEKTMTDSLLDFGTSFWKSDAARAEFPGLQTHFEPRGRYGIGFFSVFMWADNVKVSSRKFNEGLSDARILEFSEGLGSRPILRPATTEEVSTKFSTKISLKICTQRWQEIFATKTDVSFRNYRRTSFKNHNPLDNENVIAQLTAMLKIPVHYGDQVSTKLVNLPNWETAGSDEFISFLEKILESEYPERIRRFSKSETLIKDNDKVIGRAFLCPNFIDEYYQSLNYYELGIFVDSGYSRASVHGIVEGRAKNAARDRVQGFDIFSDKDWLNKQIDYMSRISENIGDAIACQESLAKYGHISRKLPIAILNRRESSLDDLIAAAGKHEKIKFSLQSDKENEFKAKQIEGTAPFIGKNIDENKLHFLVDLPDHITADNIEDFISQGNGPLALIMRELTNSLGPKSEIYSNISNLDSYSRRQALNIEIRRAPNMAS